ncbi:hypothetical protein [Paraburkholderia sp. DGU8]|uniref:hypothetical protein n=1 Tax=Paraburkholderia sp. DGU8 TaxID=3161997 RepID=UPI00346561ED
MTCLNERVVCVIFVLHSGFAFAGDFAFDSPAPMTVANIPTLPVEVIAPVPQPGTYLQHYEMEHASNQDSPFHTQIENFYSAPLTHQFQFGAANTSPTRDPALQPASNVLHLTASTAPQLSIVESANATLTIGSGPQRRLTLKVDDWVFSATARIAILHSHSTGATLFVRRGF